jgi:uncharacterized protein (TIGR02145 family)
MFSFCKVKWFLLATWWLDFKLCMRKLFLLFLIPLFIYSCSKKESNTSVTAPVITKLSGCDSIKQGLLKTTSDTLRLVSCLSISGCDSVRLGLIRSTKDLLRLGCNSSITIGKQQWMIVNLDVETYRNGDTIPQVIFNSEWAALTTGAWCYYNNDPANGARYGKLYNWYALNDPRGLSPKGWHIPTDAEWTTLTTFLGGEVIAGGKLKEVGTFNWQSPNRQATNESGFSALPGGRRSANGSFVDIGTYGNWWSATQSYSSNAWYHYLNFNDGTIGRYSGDDKKNGLSVRCLKD